MLVDACQALSRSCQQLNFYFPGKTEQFYWLRTKNSADKPVQLASTFSQQLLKFCLDFLSSSKYAKKFKCSLHLANAWHLSSSLYLNPYNFISYSALKCTGIVIEFHNDFVESSAKLVPRSLLLFWDVIAISKAFLLNHSDIFSLFFLIRTQLYR